MRVQLMLGRMDTLLKGLDRFVFENLNWLLSDNRPLS